MTNTAYVALSRQIALFDKLKVATNNVANETTNGFQQLIEIDHAYDIKDHKGVKLTYGDTIKTFRDLAPGTLTVTDQPFDLGIEGKNAYFTINTPAGTRYTRNGHFVLDFSGKLITQEGHPVLDQNGQAITFAPTDTDIRFGPNGEVIVNQQLTVNIGIVSFSNEQLLTPVGNNLYQTSLPAQNTQNFSLVQGAVEGSNVNPVTSLTKVIEIGRDNETITNLLNSEYKMQSSMIDSLVKFAKDTQ